MGLLFDLGSGGRWFKSSHSDHFKSTGIGLKLMPVF